jgi:hypothetical protein
MVASLMLLNNFVETRAGFVRAAQSSLHGSYEPVSNVHMRTYTQEEYRALNHYTTPQSQCLLVGRTYICICFYDNISGKVYTLFCKF